MSKAQNLKESAISILCKACFELHKWHSNEQILETENPPSSEPERSYAKEQLGVEKGETKLLRLAWDKRRDTIGVTFPDVQPAAPTKRSILGAIAKIYDPLGLVSPVTLAGKRLYREACDLSIGWDKPLPDNLNAKWSCWVQSLPQKVQVPRSLTVNREDIKAIDLHAFGDANKKGVSTAVYAVVYQELCVNQGLTTSKSRLAKKIYQYPG